MYKSEIIVYAEFDIVEKK